MNVLLLTPCPEHKLGIFLKDVLVIPQTEKDKWIRVAMRRGSVERDRRIQDSKEGTGKWDEIQIERVKGIQNTKGEYEVKDK